MAEFSVTCEECGQNVFFGVRYEPPVSEDELRDLIVAKLGEDGAYICPRCQSLVFVHVGENPIATPGRLQRAEQAQRIGRAARGIRFGVGEPTGARSSVWRLWMNQRRDDVYISARSLASQLKVSLHPGFWYYGFTQNYADRGTPLIPPGSDRKQYVWGRPNEFGPGWTRAFSIIVPASEVVEAPTPYTGSEVVWLPAAPPGEARHFTILLSKAQAARGRRGYPSAEGFEQTTEFVTRLSMTTGEDLWVLSHVAPMTSNEAARLKLGRETLIQLGQVELAKRAGEDPKFSARAIVFADSEDGVASFIDVSLGRLSAPP